MRFDWNNSLSVGYDLMDTQHRRIFQLNSQLSDLLTKDADANEADLGNIIGELLSYTQTHFSAEEALMQDVGFPNFLQHKKAHETLVGIVHDLETKLLNGEVRTVAKFLPTFIGDWLTRHIAVEDKQYAIYIRTRPAVQITRNRL
jgi:hemerythrin-like metal-binding protein